MLTNSTLRLEASKQGINYQNPWAVGSNSNSSATVTILEYRGEIYMVTNAHAVLDSTYLKVKLNQNSTELPVEIVWNDPIRDLAIVKTTSREAEDIIMKMIPLTLLPDFQPQGTEVFAYGYPTGGKSISFTKGNISRVEISRMVLSHEVAITVQTSAPINPGNSGGPITVNSKEAEDKEVCIGIVAQSNPNLQNTGYFIPACTVIDLIEQFNKYHRFKKKGFINLVTAPHLEIEFQELKNKPLRSALGLPQGPLDEELTGILVNKVPQKSCAYGLLKSEDIIQKIDGVTIQSNGQIKVEGLDNPIAFHYLILQKKYLDWITVEIQRKNVDTNLLETKIINIQLTKQPGQSVLSRYYGTPLRYHIQPSGKGAFVFICITRALIHAYKAQKTPSVPPFFSELRSFDPAMHQVIALQQIITSEETDGFENFPISKGKLCTSHCVSEVNGHPITNLFDLVQALTDIKEPVEIRFANDRVIYVVPSTPENISSIKEKQSITFFTSSSSKKIDFSPVVEELKTLGARENNRYEFLRPAPVAEKEQIKEPDTSALNSSQQPLLFNF